jgi:hypothetical protein
MASLRITPWPMADGRGVKLQAEADGQTVTIPVGWGRTFTLDLEFETEDGSTLETEALSLAPKKRQGSDD